MGVGRNTIAKYREGDPKELNMYGIRQSKLDPFYDFIIQCLNSGWSKSKTVKAIYEKGYSGSTSNAFEHLCKIEQKEKKTFEPQPYIRTMTECLKYRTGSIGKKKDYITREGVFRHMWLNTALSSEHKKYIYDKYSNVWELHCCIKEFRNIFKTRRVPLLYLFVEKYCKSKIKTLKSFAKGLKRNINAVENAIAYDYSNGFVEGTNSRLKMIKRTMYGRSGKRLLEAKLRYMENRKTDNCGRIFHPGLFILHKRHCSLKEQVSESLSTSSAYCCLALVLSRTIFNQCQSCKLLQFFRIVEAANITYFCKEP